MNELWTPTKVVSASEVPANLFLPNGEIWSPTKRRDVASSPYLQPAPAILEVTDAEKDRLRAMRWFREAEYLKKHTLPGQRFMPPIGGGAASAWAFTNGGRTSLLNGTFDIDTDSWKMGLFLSTSDIGAASTTFAAVTNPHAAANGYTAGGIAITLTLAGTTTVTVDISVDPVWTASGGSIIARFAVIYEVSGNVLVYATLDSTPADVTATDGNTLTVAANVSGVFTLA